MSTPTNPPSAPNAEAEAQAALDSLAFALDSDEEARILAALYRRAFAAGQAQEREECAKIADEHVDGWPLGVAPTARAIAAALRARAQGETR